jgi:hypothetical protein
MMKKIRMILLLIVNAWLVMSAIPAWADTVANPVCVENPSFVPRSDLVEAKIIWNAFDKQMQGSAIAQAMSSYTADNLVAMYEADINNDHKLKYVFEFKRGNTGYIDLVVLQKNNGRFSYLALPKPATAGEGPWYFYPYTDKKTKQDQFLTQLCGQTYMVFSAVPFADAYIWKQNATFDACDNNWLNYQRFLFQKLYRAGLYSDAANQLGSVLGKCKTISDQQLYMWAQNDVALALFKKGDAPHCNEVLRAITGNPAYAQASAQLKDAVTFNSSLCQTRSY